MTGAPAWLDALTVQSESGLFGHPWALVLLVPVALLVGVAWWRGRVHRATLERLFRGALLDKVWPRSVRTRRTIRDALLLTAAALAVLALARPRYGKEVQLVKQRGIDLVLVLDLSRSMDATDVDPSRLERARREVVDLLEMVGDDRIGLVEFAGGAYPRMPLSRDRQAVRMLVDEASTDDFVAQGSALGEAIREAVRLLGSDEASKSGKAVLILSDGEVHEPADALAAAEEARQADVRVFAMGIGVEAAPIPLPDGTFQRDAQGRRVMSQPSAELLTQVARATGGAYVPSDPTDNDMNQLYRVAIRGAVEAGLTGATQRVTWKQAYQWPLGIALLLGLAAAWLGDGKRPWGAAAGWLLVPALLSLAAPAPAWAASVAEGDAAYRAGRFQEAIDIFTDLAFERPGDPDVLDRLAAARYRAGDFDGAARAWDRVARQTGDPDAVFDAGNAHYRAGRLEEAIERYDVVLSEQPNHPGAVANRGRAEQELGARRVVQQPPPEPQPQDNPQQGDEPQPQEGQQQEGQADEGQQPQDGAPQEGEQPEEGQQPQEGQPPQEGQEGEQGEESQQQEGTAEGDPQRSDSEQTGDNDSQGQAGDKELGEGDGTREDSDRDDEAVDPGDLQGDGEGEPTDEGGEAEGGSGSGGEPGDAESKEAEAARRELEGIEEGRPRVRIPGQRSDKPW